MLNVSTRRGRYYMPSEPPSSAGLESRQQIPWSNTRSWYYAGALAGDTQVSIHHWRGIADYSSKPILHQKDGHLFVSFLTCSVMQTGALRAAERATTRH